MDFKELLNVADYNKAEARSEASIKRYSSVLPPPKKVPKSGVQSENIKRFLERKKAEEKARAIAAQLERENLLSLRASNSKNSKKAKIMASRTKDNDFSKIKLTEDEIEAKKKREAELMRKNLADKKERMKARLEMVEKEKLLPKKRKRKSKHNNEINDVDDHDHDPHFDVQNHVDNRNMKNGFQDRNMKNGFQDRNMKNGFQQNSNSLPEKNSTFKKPRPPPPPSLSFSELLKVAEKKQYEPVQIPVKKKEEEKLMTRKERRLMEQERDRLRRKQELLERGLQPSINRKPSNEPAFQNKPSTGPKIDISAQASAIAKKPSTEKSTVKKPVVIHIERDSKPTSDSLKPKFPTSSSDLNRNTQNLKPQLQKSRVSESIKRTAPVEKTSSNSNEKIQKHSVIKDPKSQIRPIPKKENFSSVKEVEIRKKVLPFKKNGVETARASVAQVAPLEDPIASIKEVETLKAAIEAKVRNELVQELEGKFAARFDEMILKLNMGQQSSSTAPPKPVNDKILEKSKPPSPPNKAPVTLNKDIQKAENQRIVTERMINAKKNLNRPAAIKKQALPQKSQERRPVPVKKPFHTNPYLDPPRRLLEPQRPPKPPPKRRIESDDEDEDDDMSDFIDDGPSQNDEDYSKYIKEIFGYDRNKYVDEDDDDIVETSFAEQMKEEVRSAKLGYLEDLEEEKLQQMEKKKKKKFKK